MRPISILAAVGLWCLSRTAHSYQIDAGCGDSTQFVREMVEQAFTMVNLASAAVKASPIDPNTNWLGEQLFGVQDFQLKDLIEGGFDQAAAPNNRGVTLGISVFANEQTGSLDSLSKNEVVIFCTTDRLSKMKESKEHMFDKVAKKALHIGNDDDCGSRTFMWTHTFHDQWDQIQICPWFLKYAKFKKNRTIKDLTSFRAILAVAGLDKLITKALLTPIDLLSLWDKTMLHEFMHTKAGGSRTDEGDGWNAYGWKNAKTLGKDGRGDFNCDNWALFGSALYWFQNGSPIDENGKFTSRGSGGGGSSGGKRWLGSGASNAWGHIKAKAVERFT